MTKIFAHRGYSGCYPENTILAIKKAVELGVDGIEIDVHLSKDKELIVIHDEMVDRTTNGSGYIKNLTLDEIKKLDAGSWFSKEFKNEKVPTLDEIIDLLDLMDFTGILNIEIKTDKVKYKKIEKILVKKMKSEKLKFDYIYSSFNFKSLKKINKLDYSSKKAFLTKKLNISTRIFNIIQKDNHYIGINPNIKYLKRNCKFIDNYNKDIMAWTINLGKDMVFCFNNNISAIFTNYPELALELRSKNGV